MLVTVGVRIAVYYWSGYSEFSAATSLRLETFLLDHGEEEEGGDIGAATQAREENG